MKRKLSLKIIKTVKKQLNLIIKQIRIKQSKMKLIQIVIRKIMKTP